MERLIDYTVAVDNSSPGKTLVQPSRFTLYIFHIFSLALFVHLFITLRSQKYYCVALLCCNISIIDISHLLKL